MTKSATWKRNRDERRAVALDENMVELHELDALIKGTSWRRGWHDVYMETAQIAITFLIRDGVDTYAVIQWPAYEGWGGKGTLIPRSALDQARHLLDNPPPPQLQPVQ